MTLLRVFCGILCNKWQGGNPRSGTWAGSRRRNAERSRTCFMAEAAAEEGEAVERLGTVEEVAGRLTLARLTAPQEVAALV